MITELLLYLNYDPDEKMGEFDGLPCDYCGKTLYLENLGLVWQQMGEEGVVTTRRACVVDLSNPEFKMETKMNFINRMKNKGIKL